MASILALPNLPPACAGTLRDASEARLLALIGQGHEDAFGEVVERYERVIRAACARRVGFDQAGDVTQQAFLQALMALRRGGGPAEPDALQPWLLLIARNCCIDHLRSSGPETVELSHAIDGVPQPPQIAEQRDHVRRTVALLQVLPSDQRRALVARELEGRSYDEISAELGATDGGVRQMIFRARSAVRRGVAVLLPLPRVLLSFRGSESAAALLSPHGETVLSCIVVALSGCAPFVAPDARAPQRPAPAARHAPAPKVRNAATAPAAAMATPLAVRAQDAPTTSAPAAPTAAHRRRHHVAAGQGRPVPGSSMPDVVRKPGAAAQPAPGASAGVAVTAAPEPTPPTPPAIEPAAPTTVTADTGPSVEQPSVITASDVEPSTTTNTGKVKKNGRVKPGRGHVVEVPSTTPLPAAPAQEDSAGDPVVAGSSVKRHGKPASVSVAPPPAAATPTAEPPPSEAEPEAPATAETAEPGHKPGRGHGHHQG